MSKISDDDKKAIASILAGAGAALLVAGSYGTVAGAAAAIAALLGWRPVSKAVQLTMDSIPEDVKLYLPAILLAREQMIKDLDRSPLIAPSLLDLANEKTNAELNVLQPREELLGASKHINRIKKDWVWATATETDIALLSEMDQAPSPLRVDCQSICVGAYAAFVSMKKRYESNFEIDPGAASGRETAQNKGYEADDILVTADAPMVLGADEFRFEKAFLVTTEEQSILQKKGMHHHDRPTVFVYPLSSVEHQLMCMAEQNSVGGSEFKFPKTPIEVPILDLSDYLVLDKTMKPGDYVIGWDPLRTSLLASGVFDEVSGTSFSLPLSVFISENTKFDIEHLDAFLRLFIAEMANIKANPHSALTLLLLDKPFRDSLIRGAALPIRQK